MKPAGFGRGEKGAGIISDCAAGALHVNVSKVWVFNDRKCFNFTHRSLLWPSIALLCISSPLLVKLWREPAVEIRERLSENLEEQFLQRVTPGGSGLTGLLLRKSRCLFSFNSILMRTVSESLVGLRQNVMFLRPRRCSCLSALISTFWSKEDFPGDTCTPLALVAEASMARLSNISREEQM